MPRARAAGPADASMFASAKLQLDASDGSVWNAAQYKTHRDSISHDRMPAATSGHRRAGSSMKAANAGAFDGQMAAGPGTVFDRNPSAYSSGYPRITPQAMRRSKRRSSRGGGGCFSIQKTPLLLFFFYHLSSFPSIF